MVKQKDSYLKEQDSTNMISLSYKKFKQINFGIKQRSATIKRNIKLSYTVIIDSIIISQNLLI